MALTLEDPVPPFRIVAADCPWLFDDKLPGKSRGASKNYRCLTLDELLVFPLPPIADDAWLLFWYVTSMVDEARAVVRAWGFEPTSGEFVWVKTTGPGETILDPLALGADPPGHKETRLAFGMGRTVRNCDERCIIARRGKPEVASHSVRSVFFAPAGRHSEKPARFFSQGQWRNGLVYLRKALKPGMKFMGPAILIEPNQTIVVEQGWEVAITAKDHVVLTRKEALDRVKAIGTEADPVLLEIFNNLFMAIAEQMGLTQIGRAHV